MSLLEYAPKPSVGDVSVSRSGNVSVITLNGSVRRVIRSCRTGLLLLLSFALVMLGGHFHPGSVDMLGIWIGIFPLTVIIAIARPAFLSMQPVRWTVTPAGIGVRVRFPSQFIEENYPRAEIAEICVKKVNLKNHLVERLGLIAVKPSGVQVAHCFGPSAELLFIAEAFRAALQLEPDPLGESEFPPLPRKSWVTRQLGMGVTLVEIRPPRVGVFGVIFLVVVNIATVIALRTERVMLLHGLPWALDLGTVAFVDGLACLILWGVFALRRRVAIEINPTGLTLSEKSLLRPARESWRLDQINQLRLDEGCILIEIDAQPPAPLLALGRAADRQTIYQSLTVGLARARRAKQAISPIAISREIAFDGDSTQK